MNRIRILVWAAAALLLAARPARSQTVLPAPGSEGDLEISDAWEGRGESRLGGATGGGVGINAWEVRASWGGAAVGEFEGRLEFCFAETDLSRAAGLPLPGQLRALGAEVEGGWLPWAGWTFLAHVEPGVFTDAYAPSRDGFSAPASFLAEFAPGRAWTLVAGMHINPIAQHKVLPTAYARWQPGPGWLLLMGVPRTELSYSPGYGATWFARADWDISDFAVEAPAGYPVPAATKLEFREVPAGLGVRRDLNFGFRLELEGGAALGRRFDYFQRGLTVSVRPAGFVSLNLAAAF